MTNYQLPITNYKFCFVTTPHVSRHCSSHAIHPILRRLLADAFGPKAVAMAVVALASEADVAAFGDLSTNAAKVVAQFVVAADAELLIFKGGAPVMGQL